MDDSRERHRERESQWRSWMLAAQQGDASDYEKLLRDLLPALSAYARRRLASAELAEDLVQNVLLSIHRARHTYRPERPFGPWFWSIARHALIDVHRARGTRVQVEVAMPLGLESLNAQGADADSLEAPLRMRDLERALEQLPDRQREAVELIHLEGLSVKEAAVRAGTTAGALKVRAHRGYRALRRLLGVASDAL
jgi:RNA polymerase sigma factor (sigma-70 family)